MFAGCVDFSFTAFISALLRFFAHYCHQPLVCWTVWTRWEQCVWVACVLECVHGKDDKATLNTKRKLNQKKKLKWQMVNYTVKWMNNAVLHMVVTHYNYMFKNSNFGVFCIHWWTDVLPIPTRIWPKGAERLHALVKLNLNTSIAFLDLQVETVLQFISCFSLSSLSLSSHQCPLLDTNKHGWVDCWQRRQTKSCVNTLARTLWLIPGR